jgi:nucleoside-diphosphate kinase
MATVTTRRRGTRQEPGSVTRTRAPGILLGIGLGGFVDGIVLHQMLQWHHMLTGDAVERGLVGEIVARIERKGLRLVRAELRSVDRALAEEHYDEHRDKPFFGELVSFLTRSPVMAMVVEGPADNTWSLVRKLVGATKVDDAEPGTIRGDYATITTENLVHASDGHASAEREIKLWFPNRF